MGQERETEMATTERSSHPGDVARLTRVALRLEYATVGWNVGEAFLTIGLGAIASSLALIGFVT